jgi:hypothetical protein
MLTCVQLWKRRWVEIDDQGYIVLKPPAEAVRIYTDQHNLCEGGS